MAYTYPQGFSPYPFSPASASNPQTGMPATDAYGRAYSSLPYLAQSRGFSTPPGSAWGGSTASPIAPGGSQAGYMNMSPYLGDHSNGRYGISPDQGNLDMIRATGQSVLANNYFQTPGYQLLFGSDYAQMDPSLNPAQRYQESPGYQFAVSRALADTQRNAAARGLLESGQTQRDLVDQSMGMGLQDYYNWWDRLSGNYENYQNRLASLASAGMQNTGNDQAFNLGQAQGQGMLGTGSNLSSLYANQGAAGLGAYMNTGAAMSSNVMQGAAIQAQIEQANAASKGGGGMEGIGQIAGSLLGAFF